jgi:MoaA/NifB/PqqE/SkfB family radical SAM enzyme
MRQYLRLADYFRRHAVVALPYITPCKVVNLLLSQIELRCARTRPFSTPPFMKIEATPLCHLSCGGCAHKSKDYKKSLKNNMHLSVEHISRIIAPIQSNLVGVSLSYSGEPMLNRALPAIVQYLHDRNICTSFASNLSVPLPQDVAEALITSGLDSILVSLDGMTAKTYSQYRVGGNFQLVLDNVSKLAALKKRLGRKRPLLTLKMVVFAHNEHEVVAATAKWRSLGFDSIEFDIDHDSSFAVDAKKANSHRMISRRKPCFWAWTAPAIGWDGDVQPCCKQVNQISLGNALTENIKDVWRGERFSKLRSGFSSKNYGEAMHPVCKKCVGLEASL